MRRVTGATPPKGERVAEIEAEVTRLLLEIDKDEKIIVEVNPSNRDAAIAVVKEVRAVLKHLQEFMATDQGRGRP